MEIVSGKIFPENADMLEFRSLAQYFLQHSKVCDKPDLIHLLPTRKEQALIFHQFPDLVEPGFDFVIGRIYQGCMDM